MDELDLLAESLAHKSCPPPGNVPSNTFAAATRPVESRRSSTPSSAPTAWVLGDYTSEMTDALVALGFVVSNVRRWQNLRWYHDGRLELLGK